MARDGRGRHGLWATGGLISLLLLGGCATTSGPGCPPDTRPAVADRLYFGTAKPDGTVSAAEWSAFLAASVTPRFPSGLTFWPVSGQWRGADGAIVRESTYVLELLHQDEAIAEQAVAAIMAEYKDRFRQEAVLRVRNGSCVAY